MSSSPGYFEFDISLQVKSRAVEYVEYTAFNAPVRPEPAEGDPPE